MPSTRITIASIILPIFAVLLFSGYKPADKFAFRQAKELTVSISLDSIKPGPITQKQLGSLKQLVVKSGGATYMAKTFDFLIIPKKGPSHYFKNAGNNLTLNTLNFLRNCKPGDLVLVTNLVLLGNAKYKPALDPKWTVG